MSLVYVPAGVEAYSGATSQVFVRNQKNKKERTYFGAKYKKWETLTKTITEAASTTKGSILPEEEYDAAISIFSPLFLKNCGFKVLLANPVVGKSFVKEPFHKMGLKSIVDSGGSRFVLRRIFA